MAPATVAAPAAAVAPNRPAALDLRAHGLINPGPVHANLAPSALTELALARGEGLLTETGALVAYTGSRTGRSPLDRYLVAEPAVRDEIWWGSVNRPMEPAAFQRLLDKVLAYLQGRELFVFDGWACADPRHRLNVRVIAEKAWHALFARCLFLRPPPGELGDGPPQLTVLNACGMRADPAADGTRSEVFVVLSLERRLVLIGGTHYAGEIKKAVFSVLNYLLPKQGVFPMHCSANIGPAGDTALFFGLSGTGKTTLSADPERRLIGDDEHGWSDEGVFNIEGGCYAKTIRLSRDGEPQIWNAIRFGSVLENVVVDPATRRPDYDDDSFTENTRAAYPVDFIDNAELSGRGGHPANVLFLTCDAFGVMPPLSKLTPEQAMYHFLSGYTAKVAGTETGVTEPQATFSTCFAAPFLPLHPTRYAEMLRDKLKAHGSQVWLVNTGWTGGPVGVGHRMRLGHTRAMVRAALAGALEGVTFTPDPTFGVLVPDACPGVPPEVLRPRSTWKDPADYDAKARYLAGLFHKNFQTYAGYVAQAVRQAGPRV
ncbi:MAG TPA: phosphoenolpyruvate carboxykinase (ATP) [Gemmataceae bacterium]|nr:phosphoenolpyruvate carboxykinase (ATP) [Gemmataceae bacterium]